MANMTLISTQTVGAGGAASIDFTSIPQTYTDLYILFSGRASDGYPDTGVSVTFNGLSTNRSRRTLYGTGTAAASTTGTDIAFFTNASTATANTFSSASLYIPNYAGSTNKSVSIDGVNEQNAAYALGGIAAGLWSSTAAITQVSLAPATATNWLQYTTASLYGITKAAAPTAKATGGTITYDVGYTYHTFTSSGTFTPLASLTADILVVAGGGAGGRGVGGGGGAGGLLAFTSQSLTATGYTVTVGAGGAGNATTYGGNGGNSSFGALTASVGGGGGGTNNLGSAEQYGRAGGSGGGSYGTGFAGGAGTSGQGYAGGSPTGLNYGAGGGGAGGVGGNGPGANGVNTYASWATTTGTGDQGYYAGGGAGGYGGIGGLGGGGGNSDGMANTGGGGYGGKTGNGYNGGSGIVIVRYAN